jgi:hypothetical protein
MIVSNIVMETTKAKEEEIKYQYALAGDGMAASGDPCFGLQVILT